MKEIIINRSNNFRVILGLAVPHPRPHLIFLYNGKRTTFNTIYDLNCLLFENFINMIKKSFIKIGPGIFSIHLGIFQSKESPHFHAHYCIPIDRYVDLITDHTKNLKFYQGLREWPIRLANEGLKWKKHDLKLLHQDKKIHTYFSKLPNLSRNFSVKFHSSQPRIAFIPNKHGPHHNSIKDLVLVMMEFSKHYKLNDSKHGGCHLCIQHELSIDSEFNDVQGYLQVDIVNYYRINPYRKKWLKLFEQEPYVVIT